MCFVIDDGSIFYLFLIWCCWATTSDPRPSFGYSARIAWEFVLSYCSFGDGGCNSSFSDYILYPCPRARMPYRIEIPILSIRFYLQ